MMRVLPWDVSDGLICMRIFYSEKARLQYVEFHRLFYSAVDKRMEAFAGFECVTE